ncbi:MAG: hypothetical protein M3395_05835 [Chloroflexota bacterium]|nr:hypothetical protein [Chloroflexota bacterium]
MAIDLLDGIRRRASSVDVPERRDFSLPDIDLHDLPKPDLAAAGRAVSEGVGALGKRIDEIGRDMRQVRVVKGPEPRVAPAAGAALLGGLGLGMGLMYFMDPRVGQQRRERLVSRIQGLFGQVKQTVNDKRGATASEWDDIGTGDRAGSFGSGGSLATDPLASGPLGTDPLADPFASDPSTTALDAPELAESRV